jgi:catabolite regulation protein CreA
LYQVQAGFNTRDSEEEFGKEFKRIRVNSNNSPSSIDIFKDDNIDDVVSVILESTLKNRNGFEQDIPKESVSRKRVQGVNFSFRINHNKDESFYLNSVTIQYFMLK